MFARRPAQGKPSAPQVTKGKVSGSHGGTTSATRSAQPAAAAKPPGRTKTVAAGNVPSGSLKRSAVPATSTRQGGKIATLRSVSSAPSRPNALHSSSESHASAAGKPSSRVPETDSLQEAAHTYSWLYMSSTLDEARKKTEKTVLFALETRSQGLAAEEEAVAEARIRFEAEQLLEFYDILARKEAPALRAITEAFLRHEAECMAASNKALKLSEMTGCDITYLRSCNSALSELNTLLNAADRIESDIMNLPSVFYKDDSKIEPVIHGLLSVHRSRSVTLMDSYHLVNAQKTTARLQLELQSLEL